MKKNKIAVAIETYLKALRVLGRERTSIAAIADALHLTDTAIEKALLDCKIVGTIKHANSLRTMHTRYNQVWSPVIIIKLKK